ncbi:MAG: hypothetical protein FWD60_03910 [Candidatus Azobacteroides sp.]|nr:hypothetical protein [Candidatus Azobacteroides sp.]
MKIKLSLSVVLLVFVQVMLWSQTSINSPYSRGGYGELADPSFGAQKAMGGIGYGLREANIINPLNPASFSRVDSMTFMFDIAVSGQRSWFNDGFNKSHNTNGRLEYVAMQFPLSRNLGMGFGFKPVTYVGYKYGMAYTDSVETYSGSGGFNQVYGALSYNFRNISVGVNVGYLFGQQYNSGQVTVSGTNSIPTVYLDTLSLSGLILDFGIQYTKRLENNRRLVVGAVYTPKLSSTGNFLTSYEPVVPVGDGYEMPEKYAFGVSYAQERKFLLGADFSFQRWSDVEFGGKKNVFNDRMRINLGGEYIPNARGRSYLGLIRYRLGVNYANSYISPVSNINDQSSPFNEYSVSGGFGLPLVGGRSMVNLAFEYQKVQPKEQIQGMIKEQYFRITIGYTFNELWFFQRKVQ